MPSSALDALQILVNGPQTARRFLPTYDFASGVPSQGELESPFEQEMAGRADRADARDRAAVEKTRETNDMVNTYNRPDVTAIRQHEEENALKKLLLPIETKGRYDVEAAKQAQIAQAQRDERLFGQRTDLREQQDQATAARAAANNKSLALRQRLAALQTGKAHATPPTGLSSWIPGAQSRADQAEIAQIMPQLAMGPEEKSATSPIPASPTPSGRASAAEILRRRGIVVP